ncbi:MAG TPA: helix-turn-helix domain-containing protein [Pseudorhodoplanes sp.]|nr:helix-turn-helix domain-containing protein [Pseudorhodoplanes sp.]
MQLVAYRNTERSAHYTAAPSSENQRLASQVSFMERRKAELSAELKTMVRAREKEVKRLAYERTLMEAEFVRRREEFEKEISAHELRLGEILSAINRRKGSDSKGYRASFDAIAERLCRAFGISRLAMLGDRQSRDVALCRQAFCYWSARLTGAGPVRVGTYLGRDHSTVAHAKKTYVAKRRAQGRTLRDVR